MAKFSFQHTYKYPWELVTHTHLTKYPSEKEKNILGIEYIESRKGPDSTVFLKMVITCLNIAPSVFHKFKVLSVPHIYYEEECQLDMKKRFMRSFSKPVGFDTYADLNELSTFTVAPENPNWTLFVQEGTIQIKGFGKLSWILEMFVRNFLTRGAKRNTLFMEELMEERLAAFKLAL